MITDKIRLPDTFRKSASGETKSTIVSLVPGQNTYTVDGQAPSVSSTSGATTGTVTASGSFPPPETYDGENGRLDTSLLVSIGNGHKLEKNSASAYLRMVEAARLNGISWTVTDSYRTYEVQYRLAQPPPVGKGLYSQGGLAAYPGTSNHGFGTAVDLGGGANSSGTPQNNWLVQNANKFGFYTIPREPWHWEYRGTGG